MAALVTANRWSAKLETHKTKEGQILCTGIGCVGCFPELYKKQASVLGICDVDKPVYSLRPWLNDKAHKSKVKRTRKKKGKSKTKQEDEKAVSKHLSCDENKRTDKTETNSDFSEHVDARPIEESALQSQDRVSSDKAEELHSIDAQFPKEIAGYAGDKEICTGSDVAVSNAGEITCIRQTAVAVYDSMYIGRDRNIALSLQDDCLPSRSFSIRDDTKQVTRPNGEDVVCFFFVLEYYRSARVLPVFKVMEIVESLNETVDLADIKCIQRVNGCWRIVLRSRKYTNTLRESGVRIRGRIYELIDDTDSYFDVLY